MDIFNKVVNEAAIKNIAGIIGLLYKSLIAEGLPENSATEMVCTFIAASIEHAEIPPNDS